MFKSVRDKKQGGTITTRWFIGRRAAVDLPRPMYGQYSQSAASNVGGVFDPASRPFRVVYASPCPTPVTRANVNKTQAILWAVGILTVFLAVVALYYVVKYIVIKPLNHLREVSDAVARGDLDQRADIHTNDEFEDLAISFNKMLVHLVETQGELQDANVELDHKVDELAHLNMQLHEMNRLKGEFLANMSHELRTPLNSIIGFSEVLQSLDALNDKQKRYAQNIQKSGRQLMDLINDILDLAKMEAGKMEVRLSEFRIDQVIANQCDLVREMAEEKNIDLRDRDRRRFAAALSGSDESAADSDESAVQRDQVHARRGPDHGRRGAIRADKSNSGSPTRAWAFAESEQEIIFEKFRQGKPVLGRDNLTREYSGTGLGLSIVKELCKLLGGEVTVESELGKGSTFRVVIPWMRTDTAAAAAKLAARLDDVSRPPPGKCPRRKRRSRRHQVVGTLSCAVIHTSPKRKRRARLYHEVRHRMRLKRASKWLKCTYENHRSRFVLACYGHLNRLCDRWCILATRACHPESAAIAVVPATCCLGIRQRIASDARIKPKSNLRRSRIGVCRAWCLPHRQFRPDWRSAKRPNSPCVRTAVLIIELWPNHRLLPPVLDLALAPTSPKPRARFRCRYSCHCETVPETMATSPRSPIQAQSASEGLGCRYASNSETVPDTTATLPRSPTRARKRKRGARLPLRLQLRNRS